MHASRRVASLWSVALLLASCSAAADDPTPYTTSDFEFVSGGRNLSGIIDQPTHCEARALVIFVHGYGNTDVRGWNMYSDLRTRFSELGIASATWDKPGQGRSEGEFDINQAVDDSAREVLDAIAHLRANEVPGWKHIGLWGISRAGWIVPIAISQDPGIKFWISVSGVTAEDNYFYLLKSNLPIEGRTGQEAEALMAEWKRGFEIFRAGGSYEDYRAATRNLRNDPFIKRMMGKGYTKEEYESEQASYLGGESEVQLDEETGMPVYVRNFDEMLRGLNIDVLALFGEKDRNVDWRKTRALYEATIGENPDATLTVRSFPDGNHNIDRSETGSIREMSDMQERVKAAGYYDVQIEWLKGSALP